MRKAPCGSDLKFRASRSRSPSPDIMLRRICCRFASWLLTRLACFSGACILACPFVGFPCWASLEAFCWPARWLSTSSRQSHLPDWSQSSSLASRQACVPSDLATSSHANILVARHNGGLLVVKCAISRLLQSGRQERELSHLTSSTSA